MNRVKITNTGGGSAKYGPCEVCGSECETVFIFTEKREFYNPVTGKTGFTSYGCRNAFGHRKCLESLEETQ